jgi:D-glycero-alpha-D-manno-heptose-7-phosphate kinase
MTMPIRARAPLRISFGGGGTELSPYLDLYGGLTLSTTISSYASCTISIQDKGVQQYISQDTYKDFIVGLPDLNSIDLSLVPMEFKIAIACSKFVANLLAGSSQKSFTMTTASDAPQGSGLGASSVLTVACLKAFDFLYGLHWTKSELAKNAFFVEREMLGLSGGRQDHYAAAYGGLNYVEYSSLGPVSVEPINLSMSSIRELEASLLMVYTGTSRESANIIQSQQSEINNDNSSVISSLHKMKELAIEMRKSLLKGDFVELGELLGQSWELKKQTSPKVSNESIDELYDLSLKLGAYGGKLSGAGGGGFLLLIVPPERKYLIAQEVIGIGKIIFPTKISSEGAVSWS